MKNGVFFVTRLKFNAVIAPGSKRAGRKAKGISDDRKILLGKIPDSLRMVCYRDPETGKELRFVTNADHLNAKTIADLYKERWQSLIPYSGCPDFGVQGIPFFDFLAIFAHPANLAPMVTTQFDPFNDRLSRDIRNDLSEAFAKGLSMQSLAPVEAVAERYRATGLAPVYEAYISERLARYETALATIRARGVEDTFTRSLVLWDLGLFFEVHEILEHAWLKTQGPEKAVLQAMIRAAGAYIKLAAGNMSGARKMADKAIAAFMKHRQAVPAVLDLDALLARLRVLDPQPPRLFPL